jgi:uncharacterized protein
MKRSAIKRLHDQATVRRWGADILNSKGMEEEKRFMQHGDISCYRHSLRVAYCSVRWARRLHIEADTRALVRGALLHDYFLYDWHEKDASHKWHGFHHPNAALRNASLDFNLSPRERDVIRRHMFPLTLVPPRCRESWIVCLADKWCALQETLAIHFGMTLKE